ncbi:hypothetical protein PIB30_047643 [Stylosanthes scabra]|uniref:Uncharacterized protein n=1 Tax=Stylosanthes scabra TaxID=79078 RepID=A0ABU6UG46_9FABA|nr:hypothetical protein [Stylosanthes scabra]
MCRVTTSRGGDPGASGNGEPCTWFPGWNELFGRAGMAEGRNELAPQAECSAKRLLGMACESLGLGLLVFVPQQILPVQGKELYGFTVILPKSKRGLEVVAYGPACRDDGTARNEAAELMLQRVLAATNEKIRLLEAECAELKQVLGLG